MVLDVQKVQTIVSERLKHLLKKRTPLKAFCKSQESMNYTKRLRVTCAEQLPSIYQPSDYFKSALEAVHCRRRITVQQCQPRQMRANRRHAGVMTDVQASSKRLHSVKRTIIQAHLPALHQGDYAHILRRCRDLAAGHVVEIWAPV